MTGGKDLIAATVHKNGLRDDARGLKEEDASGNHRREGSRGAKEDEAVERDEGGREIHGVGGHLKSRADVSP